MTGPLSYVGGKNRLAKRIIGEIPPHTTYVEPFAGGAQVLFRKLPSRIEVINDLDGELVNFYRICQAHHDELVRYMRFTLLSRKWFDLLQNIRPESLTDIQRAARYFFLLKSAYGGRVTRQNYAIHVVQRPNFSTARIRDVIEQTHDRLARVQIECLPYERVLQRYDRKQTFFYLDPPYFGVRLYRHNFELADFQQLASNLEGIQGKFLLSINDHREVRRLFSKFKIESVRMTYSVQRHSGRIYGELLIKNY